MKVGDVIDVGTEVVRLGLRITSDKTSIESETKAEGLILALGLAAGLGAFAYLTFKRAAVRGSDQ